MAGWYSTAGAGALRRLPGRGRARLCNAHILRELIAVTETGTGQDAAGITLNAARRSKLQSKH